MRSALLASLFLTLQAQALTLKELRAALSADRAAHWQAENTPQSALTQKEIQGLLGAQLPEGHDDFTAAPAVDTDTRLPSYLDWRNHGATRFAAPILDQGRCGSCVAFAAVYLLETQMNITHQTPSSPWSFSPQHLFSCGGGSCDRGWQLGSAASYLKSRGVPDEACFPYASGAQGKDMACKSSCADSAARSVKITKYGQPTSFFSSVSSIKSALQKGPVMTGFTVYEDFLYYKSGVYKHVAGSSLGGHAVTIVGYDDAERAWIVANSWGPDFGEGGFFRFSWDSAGGFGSSTFTVEVAPQGGYVALAQPRDREVISGTIALEALSTYTGTQKVEWNLRRRGGGRPLAEGIAPEGARISLDTTSFADGVYLLEAVAHHAGGVSRSAPKQVYVLNGAHQGNLTLLGPKDGETVSGAVKFELEVSAQPVPFNLITFKATNLSTGEVTTRRSPNLAPEMYLNWRTDKLPKGDYSIEITAQAGDSATTSVGPVRLTVQ